MELGSSESLWCARRTNNVALRMYLSQEGLQYFMIYFIIYALSYHHTLPQAATTSHDLLLLQRMTMTTDDPIPADQQPNERNSVKSGKDKKHTSHKKAHAMKFLSQWCDCENRSTNYCLIHHACSLDLLEHLYAAICMYATAMDRGI